MADVLTVVAKVRAAKGKGDALAALLKEQVAKVRSTEPGTESGVEVEFYRSITD